MFPKAKIHRFNDDTSCAPPPGTYDPKIDTHVPNVVIPSSKRFPDQLFSSTSLENLKKSTPDLNDVVFRTPQPSRKRIPKTPQLSSLQSKKFDTPVSGSSVSSTKSEENLYLPTGPKAITRSDYNRLEQQYSSLADKFKCVTLGLNLEISTLKDELLEIKTHEAELKLILDEKNEQEQERSKEVLELKGSLDVFEQKLVEERLCHKKYIFDLEAELEHIKEKKEELEGIISTKESAITNISEKYNNLEDEIIILKEELDNKNEVLTQVKETHSELLESLVSQSELKLDQLEKKLYLKVQDLDKEFDKKLEENEVDFQTKLNYFSHDFDLKKNCIEKEMNVCLSKVSELEDLVEKTTKGFTKDIDEANERCKLLFRELCKVESERDDLLVSDLEKKLSMMDIQEKCDSYAEDCETFKEKCKNYEITLTSMRSTVDVLSTRLVESENEVERLCLVEVDLDTQKRLLEEKSQLLLEDIMTLREGMARLEKDIINDVAAQREHLAAKVEGYKAEVSRQVGYLNNQINEKQRAINMLLRENDYLKKENERKNTHINELRYKVKQYKEDIIHLKTSFSKLEDDFNDKLSAQKNLYKILNDKLMKANIVIDELTVLKINHDVTIASLLQKNVTYQKEVLRVEKELNVLKTKKIEQEGEISSLKTKIEINQSKFEKFEDENAKQQQYIDGLVSDLVLEKERCVVLENEKDGIKQQLAIVESESNAKLEELESLKSKLSVAEANLTIAEDNLTANLIAKAKLESELIAYQTKENELSSIHIEQLEKKNSDLHALLASAKEKIKSEIPKLEHDNINKAEYILELSLTIDGLKEEIDSNKTQITCLEAEKADLLVQLDHFKFTISNLRQEISTSHNQIKNLQAEKLGFLCQLEDSNDKTAKLEEVIDEQETKITCLEAEKAGLSLQLDEANYTISNLKNEITINENDNIMIISQLKDQIKAAGEREEENNSMITSLQASLQKHTELLKSSANSEIELTDAQVKINKLEDVIKMKNREMELIEENYTEKINNLLHKLKGDKKEDLETHNSYGHLEAEVNTLKSEKEELEKKLRAITAEKEKLDKEVTDLVGHHNNLQRIRHVQSLKQLNIELREDNDKLSQENIRMKAQLQEFKENPHTPRVVDTPRPPLKVKSARKLASPGVLKERNH